MKDKHLPSILLGLVLVTVLAGCQVSGDVRFIETPSASVTTSTQVQVTQGQQIQTAAGYKAITTVQSIPASIHTASGYKAVIQPIIR